MIYVGVRALDEQTIRPADKHGRYADPVLATGAHLDQVIRLGVVDDDGLVASHLGIVDFPIE